MRDPMLNLMKNDIQLFDDLLEKQPEEKRKGYEELRKNKSTVKAYLERIQGTYGDDPAHM